MKYDDCKRFPDAHGRLRYKLPKSRVWVTSFGFHHTAYLDLPPADPDAPTSGEPVDERLRHDIERVLQFNRRRFEDQAELVKTRMTMPGRPRVLDVGCGGGLFLSLLRRQGCEVVGLEPHRRWAEYARATHGFRVETRMVEDPEIQNRYPGYFDAVTLWDVFEHVNYPQDTLLKVHNLLRPGGYLFMDTPCRDGFYHRFGALTYIVSGGRWPTFLNLLYTDSPFNHKQIFSTEEMRDILLLTGFAPERIERRHELSRPYEHYLKRLTGSEALANGLAPLVHLLFRFVRIRNKMIVVARKVTTV